MSISANDQLASIVGLIVGPSAELWLIDDSGSPSIATATGSAAVTSSVTITTRSVVTADSAAANSATSTDKQPASATSAAASTTAAPDVSSAISGAMLDMFQFLWPLVFATSMLLVF
jgi:hypothetical protein